ncbi:hypothetical protein AMATHDRAFT_66410 [Amanita thiersii Skay4041]|uniref:Ubiquitin-like domain-containing protein n=1 Tax=Amanita thiersii Skay4041 TaxID=703135 RepID=A0A2A9NI82_9AGAR|nr:hypothetical protein AMATHDRAFT_66410 [Amanita thiersii Skay4041]
MPSPLHPSPLIAHQAPHEVEYGRQHQHQQDSEAAHTHGDRRDHHISSSHTSPVFSPSTIPNPYPNTTTTTTTPPSSIPPLSSPPSLSSLFNNDHDHRPNSSHYQYGYEYYPHHPRRHSGNIPTCPGPSISTRTSFTRVGPEDDDTPLFPARPATASAAFSSARLFHNRTSSAPEPPVPSLPFAQISPQLPMTTINTHHDRRSGESSRSRHNHSNHPEDQNQNQNVDRERERDDGGRMVGGDNQGRRGSIQAQQQQQQQQPQQQPQQQQQQQQLVGSSAPLSYSASTSSSSSSSSQANNNNNSSRLAGDSPSQPQSQSQSQAQVLNQAPAGAAAAAVVVGMDMTVPQTPQTFITFLLITGRRRTMSFDPETTIGRVKELVWNTWPEEWQNERPPAPSYLRLLYLGKMLQDDDTLTKLKLPTSHQQSPQATIIHLSIRPYAPPGEGDGIKKKRRMSIRSASAREDPNESSSGCCNGCIIC